MKIRICIGNELNSQSILKFCGSQRSQKRPNVITCSSRNRSNETKETPLFTQPLNATAFESEHGANSYLSPLVSGKRFCCTECGKCCCGAGEVWCNDTEAIALSRLLNIEKNHFLSTYCKSYTRRPGWYLIKRKSGTGECIFLHSDSKTCSVYPQRPTQCSTYPFWPELMSDAAWNAEAESVCEGINHQDAQIVDAREATEKLAKSSVYTADFDAAGLKRSAARRKR